MLELKLYIFSIIEFYSLRFNRTMLELKPRNYMRQEGFHFSFNRTMLELKHFSYTPKYDSTTALIVPCWN